MDKLALFERAEEGRVALVAHEKAPASYFVPVRKTLAAHFLDYPDTCPILHLALKPLSAATIYAGFNSQLAWLCYKTEGAVFFEKTSL